MLGGEHVDEDGYREAMQLVATGAWPIDPLADDGPLTAGFRTMLHKGRDAGVLVYPLVFPEVFFPTGDVDHMEGFDAEVMNPPWDKIMPLSKEFFAGYDISIVAARSKAERDDLERALRSNPVVAEAFDQYWAQFEQVKANLDCLYKWQNIEIEGERSGAQPDAYRYFGERAYQLLREDGYVGFVLPSSFYANESAAGLRQLYLSNMAILKCFTFENKRGLFDIHRSFKFSTLVAKKSSSGTDEFDVAFYLHDDSWLFSDSQVGRLRYRQSMIRKTGGKQLSFVELRSQYDLEVLETCANQSVETVEVLLNRLGISCGEELNKTRQSKYFRRVTGTLDTTWDELEGILLSGFLIFEGKNIGQFTDRFGPACDHYFPIEKIEERPDLLELVKYYRFGYRLIARSTDERTLIALVLPQMSVCTQSISIERRLRDRKNHSSLVLCCIWNSFPVDYLARQRIAATVNKFLLEALPVPNLETAWLCLAHSALRLISNHAGYAPLWTEQLGDEWRERTPRHTWPVLAGDDARWDVRAAIDAIVAQAYGLSREQYAHVLSTFSHKSYPSAPKVCLAKFDELSEIGLEAFTRKYDPYWDVPLVESLPRPVIELPNLTPGEGHVVAEGGVEYGATDMFGNPLQTDLFGEVVTSVKKRGKRK